ncbi:MAG TPA: hypothetical protein VFN61_09520, partial [Acidimicrobiales bacterium]|nr:hypothetical protein [Acidimicrobiales bacterium]
WSSDERVVAALRPVVSDASTRFVLRLIGATALAKRAGSSATGDVASLIDQAPRGDYRQIGDVVHVMAAFCGGQAWEKVFDCLATCLAEVRGSRRDVMFTRGVQYLAVHAAPGSAELSRLGALVRANWATLSEGERWWAVERWPGIQPGQPGPIGEPLRGALLEEARLGLVPAGHDDRPEETDAGAWDDADEPVAGDDLEGDVGEVEVTETPDGRWKVEIELAEFVRQPSVEARFRFAIDEALRGVDGVAEVVEEDREVWIVSGTPKPEELVQALQPVLRRFVPED